MGLEAQGNKADGTQTGECRASMRQPQTSFTRVSGGSSELDVITSLWDEVCNLP